MALRHIAALTAAAALLAGCGSSGGSSDATKKPTTTSTRPASPEDAKIAKSGVLRRSDLPDGFVPSTGDVLDLDTIILKTDRCTKTRLLGTGAAARAVSAIFQRDTTSTNDVVKVFDTPVVPKRQVELLQGPDVGGCLAATVLTIAGEGKTPAKYEASVSPIAAGDYGDATVGQRVTVVATPTSGTPTTILFDYVLVRVGRSTVTLLVITPDAATAAEIETTALPKVVDRVSAASK